MKQPKRNLVIEYKSGRRWSATTQTSSIWGNLDLKSVAQAVETDMPKPVIGFAAAMDIPSRHSAQDIVAKANPLASVASPVDGDNAVARVDPGNLVDNDALVDSEETTCANDAIGSAEGDATGETARSEAGGPNVYAAVCGKRMPEETVNRSSQSRQRRSLYQCLKPMKSWRISFSLRKRSAS